jgi:hypothetical protein
MVEDSRQLGRVIDTSLADGKRKKHLATVFAAVMIEDSDSRQLGRVISHWQQHLAICSCNG